MVKSDTRVWVQKDSSANDSGSKQHQGRSEPSNRGGWTVGGRSLPSAVGQTSWRKKPVVTTSKDIYFIRHNQESIVPRLTECERYCLEIPRIITLPDHKSISLCSSEMTLLLPVTLVKSSYKREYKSNQNQIKWLTQLISIYVVECTIFSERRKYYI